LEKGAPPELCFSEAETVAVPPYAVIPTMLRIAGTFCSARSPTRPPNRVFYGRPGGGAGRYRFSEAENDSRAQCDEAKGLEAEGVRIDNGGATAKSSAGRPTGLSKW